VRLLVAGNQTQGRLALLELAVRPADATPLHAHTREDEVIHVLQGEITVHLDGTWRRCAAGDSVLLPRGSEHAWYVESDEATLLLLLLPAGLEGYYQELARPVEPDRRIERLIAASARYGIEIVGPALSSAT
jgi:quercetin dioxygenase-like cupin family protein